MVVYRLALGLNQAAGLVAFFRNPYFFVWLTIRLADLLVYLFVLWQFSASAC
jgi:hypothetical protein